MPRNKQPDAPGNQGKKRTARQPTDAGAQSPKKTPGKISFEEPTPRAPSVTRSTKASELSAANNGMIEAPLSRSKTDAVMDPKMPMRVPGAVRELAEKTVEQAEKAFEAFMSAANKSIAVVPNPATDLSKKTLIITERNMKAAFDHARRLIHAKNLQEVMQLQAEFLKNQFAAAGEQMKELSRKKSPTVDASKKS